MRFRWRGEEFPFPERLTFAEIADAERHLRIPADEWIGAGHTLAHLYIGARRHALATPRWPMPSWDDVANSSPDDDFDVLIELPDTEPDAGPPAGGSPSDAGPPAAGDSSTSSDAPTSQTSPATSV